MILQDLKSTIKQVIYNLRERFTLDPLTKKRFMRFGEVKRAKYALILIIISLAFAFFAELFISNRALIMYVDGKLYFPTYSKMLFASDFNFQYENELELNYREFQHHLSKTKRGWLIMPLIPYNPFETAKPEGVLSKTYVGSPILGIATKKTTDKATDNPSDYQWLDITQINGLKTQEGDYVWIKYGQQNGKNNSLSDFPSKARSYIGIATHKKSATESLKPSDYQWHDIHSGSAIKQADGTYTWFKYAKGQSGEMYHPLPPSFKNHHILGTDTIGRDVFARLVYGYRIAITFSLLLVIITYSIGIFFGVLMGYYGGLFDTIFQRIIEIWERIPFLYMIMIMSAIFKPSFAIFLFIYVLFSWTGLTWSARAMTYRERERDYILAARSMGASAGRIALVHIIPNIMVIIITSLPFSISGGISSLTSLDYLGYGLRPPTPSWGELLNIGTSTFNESPWILTSVVTAMVLVLVMITFIGEGLRDAFDPRKYTVYK